jgi:hypothetical protein
LDYPDEQALQLKTILSAISVRFIRLLA